MSLEQPRLLTKTMTYRATAAAVLLLYIFVMMEWLFFVTQSSFLDSYPVSERILSLVSAPLIVIPALIGLIFCSFLFYQAILVCFKARCSTVLSGIPAAILTVLAMLLVDNFSNTVLGVGIRNANRAISLIVLVLLFFTWVLWCRWVAKKIDGKKVPGLRTTLTILTISALSLVTMYVSTEKLETQSVTRKDNSELPNIIFFAADGIQASHMSAYGYHRKTTPNLDELSENSLVVFNAVANSGRTTGSTTALLTGKYPTTTKVIFPPHVLRERHIYEHLPGILKTLGYQNIQESVRYFADAADLNMYGAFDFANGRQINSTEGVIPQEVRYKLFPAFALLEKIWERVNSRFVHLLGVRAIENVSEAVDPEKVAKVYGTPDSERVNSVLEFIRNRKKPVFAHLHLMDTHCCRHRPDVKFFSKAHEKYSYKNFVDFYDDIILETDSLFGQFLQQLKKMGEFENTIIVYSSDHTRGWHTNKSVPLILKFPNNQHSGEKYGTHQLIDIAPTILEYLGVSPPNWLEGVSLLNSEEDIQKDIFTIDSVVADKTIEKGQLARLAGSGPPLYGAKVASMVSCGQNYYLNLESGDFQTRPFPLQGELCTLKIDDKVVRQKIEKHLIERDFTLPYLE